VAPRPTASQGTPDDKDLLNAQLSVFLDPEDPAVRAQARRDGIADDWIAAARRSPVYALAVRYRVALPLHPEFRTLPMVWYVPPLSPVVNGLEGGGYTADPDDVFPAIDTLRIPTAYLANLLSAGDTDVIRTVLKRLAVLRCYMRQTEVTHIPAQDERLPASVGMTSREIEDLYRLLAIAKYEDRYVIPKAHTELADRIAEQPGARGFSCTEGAVVGNAIAPPGPPKRLDNSRFMMLKMAPPGASDGHARPARDDGAAGGRPHTVR